MGMDSGWFRFFLDAYFDSHALDLPIWRVFQRKPGEPVGSPISIEQDWDTTWEIVMRLRNENQEYIFDCNQSVYQRLS